jgi:hypothetical protein
MDTERRHELAHNDLADSTVALVDRLRPYVSTLALAALAAVGAGAAWTVISGQQEATKARSWDAMMTAINERSPDALGEVARRYAGSPAAHWSQLFLADSAIAEGSQQLFADRARARERLNAAAGLYSGLLAERTTPLVAERATFGLAKARECLGQLDEARRGYETLVAEYPTSAVRGLAENRVAALSREATRQWYAWFDEAKPVSPAGPVTPDAGSSAGPASSAQPGPDSGAAADTDGQ